MTESERDLKAFMAIAQEAAVAEAKLMPTTPDIRRRAHALAELGRDRLARMAREQRAKQPSNLVSGAIRAAIRALSPAQVIERLAELRGMHPEIQFAHRNYEHMSDDDLRSALEDIESLVERRD